MHRISLVVVYLVCCSVTIYGYKVKRGGDRSHICCEVEIKDFYLNFTHEVYETVNKTVEQTVLTDQLRDCNEGEKPFKIDLEGSKCQVSKTVQVTVEELVARNVTELIPQKGSCPPEHTICCDGYRKLGDQCVDSETANSPELQALIDAGLVVG